MENDDLKTMWKEICLENQDNRYKSINIYELRGKNHSQMMTQVVTDVKWKIGAYGMGLVLFSALMAYAWGYLDLNLSLSATVPFIGSGVFFLVQTSMEIIRLRILTKSNENRSVKESLIFFRRKVTRMIMVDFLSYMIFFYLLGIGILYLHLKDIGSMKNSVSGNEVQPLIMVLLFLILAIPWFIKYQNTRRYKKLFTDLNSSANYLEDAP
jgi:hypothetical protein